MDYDKRTVIYFVIFIIIALVFVAGAYLVYKGVFDDELIFDKEPVSEIQRQMEELDALHQEANTQPFSQGDKEMQTQALDEARQQENPEPLSQEQINQQFEELDNLRSQAR